MVCHAFAHKVSERQHSYCRCVHEVRPVLVTRVYINNWQNTRKKSFQKHCSKKEREEKKGNYTAFNVKRKWKMQGIAKLLLLHINVKKKKPCNCKIFLCFSHVNTITRISCIWTILSNERFRLITSQKLMLDQPKRYSHFIHVEPFSK